jgi:hypothetical protein
VQMLIRSAGQRVSQRIGCVGIFEGQ